MTILPIVDWKLNELTYSFAPRFEVGDFKDIKEFFEVGEYQLCVETLTWLVCEKGERITPEEHKDLPCGATAAIDSDRIKAPVTTY